MKKILFLVSIAFLNGLTTHAQTFTIGETVEATTTVHVRNEAAGTTLLGDHYVGDEGTVVDGPVYANLNGVSYYWYEVSWNSSPTLGWSAANYLSAVSSGPGNFTLTVTPQCEGTTSEIILSWTTSSGATSYDVYRDGALYYSGLTGTTFTNKGSNVVPGTNYTYYIQSKNSSGSTNSNTQSATALNCSSTCTYSIFPSSVPVSSSSGNGSVSVTTTSSCSWTATSNNTDWLTVTSGGKGTGNGTVNYSYTTNGFSSRTGTITIAGQTFNVVQSGTTTGLLHGVDVSSLNGSGVSWSQVYVSTPSHSFAYVRATKGIGPSQGGPCWEDPKFGDYIKNSNPNGVVLGTYHIALPEDNPGISGAQAEANYFLSIAGSYIGSGYLPTALDLENPGTECNVSRTPLDVYYNTPALQLELAQWVNA